MAINAPTPVFIERDPQKIIDEMVADYQARVGKRLEPAQVERLLIQTFAYRELLLRNQIQDAALQNLVSFARYPALDFLGELLGVTRLPASAAETTIRFQLVEGHGGVVIPQGIRVASVDGKVVFEAKTSTVVASGVNTADVICAAQTAGNVGNGYAVGDVNIILDPQPYLTSAANITASAGGADEESDDQLRERIRLAPAQFSTAGSKDAYKFHARGAHPSIIDVAVTSPVPGTVNIYPLVRGGGPTPQEVLDAVLGACTPEKVRPLTDTVQAITPTAVDYAINVDLILYTSAVQADVISRVTANLEAYRDGRKQLLGLDIVRAQITAECILPGEVYNVIVNEPASDLVIGESEYGNCTGITVNVTGTNNG